MRELSCLARFVASAALTVSLAVSLAGCKTVGMSGVTGALGERSEAPADPSRTADITGERYRARPSDPAAAIAYGNALRAIGQRAQAVAVLEKASLANPSNKAVRAAYGRALADNGNFQLAFDTLSRAHSPDNPDWRILSVQGTVLDQMGRNDEARRYYASALRLAPGEPSVLSNLGMSYVLTKELPRAEETLRQAYSSGRADERVRQNLALVIGLQGRYAEAESIVRADLPPDEAAANVAYLKQMVSGQDAARAGRGVMASGR
ncbi:tetratricopeptide repeat protein [Rhodopseudomonas palustris]|uniref:Tetratricopeptide TPR_2 n=1 Tax=Rhodopseudomonas palustris (strain DX-1) TaxID=652103 RepID=E6VK20_RHOPX|nr:tetratricopeptide repeat protein [Rhodopseudomonas palustris]QDL98330.1 tetratricopeptide repeat protein [Rhodopseudomonas palustris]